MDIGSNLRTERSKRGWSLEDLEQRSGVSRSMISKIERNEKNPTVNTACKIAEALGITLSRLIGFEEAREQIVIRKTEASTIKDEVSGLIRTQLSPSFDGLGLQFIRNELPPYSDTGYFHPHRTGTREYISVASGTLTAFINEEKITLYEGDSLYFQANQQHRFCNELDTPCIYYLIIQPND
ncbi:helix-turn-helix domain-containing protein [Aneurinibacillus tyrosinisolvens]|uniref:helix-turn-helix domain-containing protein n=1 Tax=Aneurinibacillus tyrosinisolvens TaxID=1443435 RepID=UPI00063F4925|nr:XRE family transcriptional regulator [Aneurinibacillus tyrosinisolvens]